MKPLNIYKVFILTCCRGGISQITITIIITDSQSLTFHPRNRQPEFCNWAFNVPRGKPCLEKWDAIPEDTDILITHTPPVGHGDLCCTGVRAGCVELLNTVQTRVKPKYHLFGHIHEGKWSLPPCRQSLPSTTEHDNQF